jgi:hypothetical protein
LKAAALCGSDRGCGPGNGSAQQVGAVHVERSPGFARVIIIAPILERPATPVARHGSSEPARWNGLGQEGAASVATARTGSRSRRGGSLRRSRASRPGEDSWLQGGGIFGSRRPRAATGTRCSVFGLAPCQDEAHGSSGNVRRASAAVTRYGCRRGEFFGGCMRRGERRGRRRPSGRSRRRW